MCANYMFFLIHKHYPYQFLPAHIPSLRGNALTHCIASGHLLWCEHWVRDGEKWCLVLGGAKTEGNHPLPAWHQL